MSIATVVTRGFGTFGSVNRLPTLGYDLGAPLTVIEGPCIVAAEAYIPGAFAGEAYTPGCFAAEVYTPGCFAADTAC